MELIRIAEVPDHYQLPFWPNRDEGWSYDHIVGHGTFCVGEYVNELDTITRGGAGISQSGIQIGLGTFGVWCCAGDIKP